MQRREGGRKEGASPQGRWAQAQTVPQVNVCLWSSRLSRDGKFSEKQFFVERLG